ncbi:MAG TPA: hypothetical protein VMR41_05760 [Patescibacteria group bacterium]|nr:hypothetical protein [Patescibacteria group bacterium]
MDYITTTNLRTQSSELVNTLKKGGVVSLIHHSKIVGVIKPKKEPKILTKTAITQLRKLAEDLSLQKISYEEREKIYRDHLMDKYGKDLS